ncbi:hypothetical protein FHS85_002927 [Rhodoligotrophos appendicifer]|uniref:carboxypeptidase-like regulatory domain-containing protein n=1 Tax=Rhodoligotrophos appendicifer TaxID=987056 RepID=UPI001185F113|nr:carboxypeptidase-like regulatory domain-containing protein [Rhodoligotrophos appendicifer]
MALGAFQRTVVDDAGNVVPSASIEVRDQVSDSIVSIYSDRDGEVSLGNPFTADTEGFFRFHVAGGAYKISATSGAFTRVWEWVAIGLLQEQDEIELPGTVVQSEDVSQIVTLTQSAYDALDPPDEGTLYLIIEA